MKVKRRWRISLLLLITILILALYPSPEQEPIRFVDRESGRIETEKVAGENWLVWLYHNPVGEVTLWTLVKRKLVSSVYGNMMESESSVDKIKPFVKEFDIDLSIAEKQEFTSFNDFFTRGLKPGARPVDTNSNVLISPSDGKVFAWADIAAADFIVKGFRFDVETFLNNRELAKEYQDGSLIVIRLAPNDYHRFHFPVSGQVISTTRVDGDYYSVNQIALREMAEIFCLNKREYTIVSNPLFGNVVIAEVGATMVGSIIQTYYDEQVKKGQEKGYFEFGGSTVVLLLKKDEIQIDDDLLTNTLKGLETKVIMGERIGVDANLSP